MAKIIIDSTTDLPDSILKKYDIDILPLRVNINSKEYRDKVDTTIEKVYDVMREGVCPVTSLPNPIDIYRTFKKHADNGEDFIFYCFSSEMSSTYQTTKLAIDELKEEYPDVKMAIVDTKAGALGAGMVVIQALNLIEAGESFEKVVELSKYNSDHIEHIFTVDDLQCLMEGGRISKGKAMIGGALKIKPLLEVKDGKIQLLKSIRGRKKAINKMLSIVEERISDFPDQIIGIAHAGDVETAMNVEKKVKERFGDVNTVMAKIGSVLASHLGLGGIGVFFFNSKPEIYIDNI